MLKTSPRGIQIIKDFEGFRARPYLCSAGRPTIGYGSTFYPTGKKVTLQDKMISEHEASIMLERILSKFEADVNSLVKVPLTQNQFDALVSFTYNVGPDIDDDEIAKGLGDSTLLRKLNRRDYLGAANEFPKWNKCNGVVNKGLTNRRTRERELFLSN